MSILKKKRLQIATIVYWILLVYIIAALIWWFIALQQQNMQMTSFKLLELHPNDPAYLQKAKEVTKEEERKRAQYIGEGSFFLFLILLGAGFVYRAVRRQLKMTQQQQNFMMAITHELKTPIAIAKLNLETLQKHRLDETRQQKLIQSTLEEANRLNVLTNNILISSQLEAGGYVLSEEELDLSLLAKTCVKDFQRRFPDHLINNVIDDDIDITGDSLLLQILVNNLLENAVKYSPRQKPISLNLKKEGERIKLKVSDERTRIPDNEKTKIFERFYRIGNEEVRKTKGTGLGLYLCKKIAEDHNADIRVTNNHPTGSIFTVDFRQ
jgi:two-component system, OmpR family, sensor histidine kinase CiaH